MSRNYSSTAVDTKLNGGVSSSATSLVVASTTGFPAAPFILAVDAGTASQELVLVTATSGTTLTVTRGYDSTVATTHDAGAVVRHSHSGLDFRDSRNHEAATAAHGATGAVVGTTNTQTLTNKTLDAGNNTISGTKAQFNTAVTDGNPVWDNEVGLWTAYTPTTQNITVGNGTLTGKYAQIGKVVHFWAKFTLGSTSAVAANPTISTPVAVLNHGPLSGTFVDDGTTSYTAAAFPNGDSVAFYGIGNNGAILQVNATNPFTWASGDVIEARGTYEAA